MENISFESYFNESINKYYDSKVMINILKDIIGKPIEAIKKDVNDNKIIVTSEQIENYLEQKFIEENPELKKRIERPRPKRSRNIVEWTEQDIEDSLQEFADDMNAAKYYFEPYTLEYFNRYTSIVRNKVNILLTLIEKIGNKDIQPIQELLDELDIVLDENGNILKIDIVRLITPTIYNYNDLNEKITKANNLSTYLTFKMSKHTLYRDGVFENEVYPNQSLQINSLQSDYIQGNVRLSEHQRKKLEEERSKSLKKTAESVFAWFD